MRYKLFGAALTLLVAYLVSRALNEREDERLLRIEGLTALLRFFRLQIDCYCVPVGEIFRRCDVHLLESCGLSAPPADFEVFLTALPPLDREAEALIRSFGGELGASFREEQLKSCDYHITKFCELRDRTAIAVKRQKRLNTTLCLTLAASAVILLL